MKKWCNNTTSNKYKGKLLTKRFENMTDDELITTYYICIHTQHWRDMRKLEKLNKYLLKTGKIELIR